MGMNVHEIFGRGIGLWIRNIRLDFGTDPDPDRDYLRRTNFRTARLHVCVCVCVCARAQKLRKLRNTSAPRAPASKSVKVTPKVKFKMEPPDEVTCSTDDIRRHSTAADVAKCVSSDDALLPDTTTENIGEVIDDSGDRVNVTSFGHTYQSVSNRIVKAVAVDNYSVTPQQQIVVPVHSNSVIGQPGYGLRQHHYQCFNIHQAAPLFYRDDLAYTAGREQRSPDDIDDILSVMASVAGISQPHVY